MKIIRILILTLFLFPYKQFSQSLADKNVLVVWGGWDDHQPEIFSNLIEEWLISQKANYKIFNGIEAYEDLDELMKYDLIIQSITMGELKGKAASNLLKAVRNGVGIAGAHGGLGDSFRDNTEYQFMIGGQWVSHPGGKVDFEVNMIEDELTKGLNDFEIYSEQWYVHYDPNIDIIATTTFSGEVFDWIEGVVMPIAWKKKYDQGKVFYISVGHDPMEFKKHPDAWELMTRGFVWACR
ncbi:MAG: ThuA domain-containing protein [Flavobacteriaceae bacterium]|nr:ThuA domain-containing protein [Flavobacteriaceae bacterium]